MLGSADVTPTLALRYQSRPTPRSARRYTLFGPHPRNVRWMIPMSRTSIGYALDMYVPPSALEASLAGCATHGRDLIIPRRRGPAPAAPPAAGVGSPRARARAADRARGGSRRGADEGGQVIAARSGSTMTVRAKIRRSRQAPGAGLAWRPEQGCPVSHATSRAHRATLVRAPRQPSTGRLPRTADLRAHCHR